ncbi:CDP-diglyceride synthetase [Nocardioides zeae]|uniref:CDP-diglyceride synthetase n=1 Tax=Nocardioides zeae TaxID=1457234 RepID=A0ACC6IH47_9ACTN|nr:hypothetical protein [Nocardioides zeae]MDR6172817.1 CDP-diglyceride synthetase [Nocardioides zeae]MDR6209827.1 CDP-diglyceride synthetase [Nocardioides zeae]
MSRFTDVVAGLVLVLLMVALALRAAASGGWWWAAVPLAAVVALTGAYGAGRALRRTSPRTSGAGGSRDRW